MTWMVDAACRDADRDLWFAHTAEVAERLEAKRICRRCKVTLECLEYAEANRIREGIYGGLTAEERRRARRTS